MSKKLDPRVVRTRRWLRDALIELVAEQGYQDVMVQDITDRAEINRATFYLHYKDKDELLTDCARELFEDVITRIETGKAAAREAGHAPAEKTIDPAAMTPAFEHFAHYADFYRIVLGENGAPGFMQAVREYYAAMFNEGLLQYSEVDPSLAESLSQYHAAGILGLVMWWLKNDMPQPPDVMSVYLVDIMLNSVRHFIKPVDC